MFRSMQEVEHERLFHLEVLKDEPVNLAVSRLPALITSSRCDEAVTTVASVVEAVIEVTSLANVEYLIMRDEEIDPSTVISSNGEATERPRAELMELPVSFMFVQLLRVELQGLAMFVSLRNERLNKAKMIPAQEQSIRKVMRFWATVRELPGCE